MKSAATLLSLASFTMSLVLDIRQHPDALCGIDGLCDQLRVCVAFVLDLIHVLFAHAAAGGAVGIVVRFLFMGLGLPLPN